MASIAKPGHDDGPPFTFLRKTSRGLSFRLLNSFRQAGKANSKPPVSRAVTHVQTPADAVATHLIHAGYARCEPAILQPASIFFDSGEDLRGQLYLTSDAVGRGILPAAGIYDSRFAALSRLARGRSGPPPIPIAGRCFATPPGRAASSPRPAIESFGRADREAADAEILTLALAAVRRRRSPVSSDL